MQDSREISLKKDLYVQLAFTLFGHIVGKGVSGKILSRSTAFVTSPEGKFFLLARISDDLEDFLQSEEVLLTVLKEGKSVSDMWDIQVRGWLSSIQSSDQESTQIAKKLFEEKSPYLGTIGFLDLEKDYRLFALSPDNIFFQNLGAQREGAPSYTLLKS